MRDVAVVEFISASTAGIVNVMLGFTPDFAILIQAHGATNPNLYLWTDRPTTDDDNDGGADAAWAAALSLLLTGSTGVVTRDTTGITKFAGGTTISAAETKNSDPKHIDRLGRPAKKDAVTQVGLAIPADHQTNSGRNLLIAFRGDN